MNPFRVDGFWIVHYIRAIIIWRFQIFSCCLSLPPCVVGLNYMVHDPCLLQTIFNIISITMQMTDLHLPSAKLIRTWVSDGLA